MTRLVRASIRLVLCTSLLGGCAANSDRGLHFTPGYAASDAVCRAQRQALADAGDPFLGDAVAVAASGAAPGGTATPGAETNTYLSSLQKLFGSDKTAMVTQMSGDVTTENSRIQRTRAVLADLAGCRRTEVQGLRDRYLARQITRDEANAAMAKIRAKLAEDNFYADKLVAGMSSHGKQFEDTCTALWPATAALLNESLPPPPQPYEVVKAYPIHAAASKSAPHIGRVSPGETVQVVSASGGWWQIVMPDGSSGYVAAPAFAGSGRHAEPPPPPQHTSTASTLTAPQLQLVSLTRTNRQGRQEFSTSVDQSKSQLAAVTQDLPASGQLSNGEPATVPAEAG